MNQKGVTLIALVVTIIVLMILAGVTISALQEDEGIILNAKEAANKHKTAAIEEEIKKMEIEVEAAKNGLVETVPEDIDVQGVIERLQGKGIVEEGELVADGDNAIQYSDGSKTFSLENIIE